MWHKGNVKIIMITSIVFVNIYELVVSLGTSFIHKSSIPYLQENDKTVTSTLNDALLYVCYKDLSDAIYVYILKTIAIEDT